MNPALPFFLLAVAVFVAWLNLKVRPGPAKVASFVLVWAALAAALYTAWVVYT